MTDDCMHVALIMDGNGRWALRRGLPRSHGHLRANVAVKSAVDAAVEWGVTHLTLFAFSIENWNRPAEEVALLMQPARWLVTPSQVAHYRRNGVQVTFLGDRKDPRLPRECTDWMRTVEEQTAASCARLQLTVAFNYGGRQEIAEAVRRACVEPNGTGAAPDFRDYLWSSALPDIDLLIRTSGECRISNFMLWSLWYAELVFTKTLWPDFRGSDLLKALEEFHQRSRRWGTIE